MPQISGIKVIFAKLWYTQVMDYLALVTLGFSISCPFLLEGKFQSVVFPKYSIFGKDEFC